MQLVRLQDAPRHEVTDASSGLPGHGASVYDLLVGTEGEPDNHGLQLVDSHQAFALPAHRHNFEQVRVALDGSFGIGPGLLQQPGQVGYFCEGTTYTQDTAGRSLTLLLQLGGPSGAGFMSRRQLREGIAALGARGEFEGGHFTWFDAQGIRQRKECYAAVWEHVNGRPIHYARPQYATPVLIDPERFAWVPMPFSSGVWLRTLGRFNDRGLAISQLKLAPGAELVLPRGEQVLLLCCVAGGGRVDGLPFERLSALRVEAGETPRLKAARDTTFFGFELPRFD